MSGTKTGLLAFLTLGLFISEPALALDTYMWGVGPRIGTTVLPGRYPAVFAPKIKNYDLDGDDERDVNDEDEEIFTSLERVKFDVIFGVDGVYYATKHTRLAATVGMDIGKRFTDGHFIARYNYVGSTGAIDFLFGGGLGFGLQGFRGEIKAEKLKISYYPLRVEGSALVRDNTRGYQATIFAQYNIPGSHAYFAQDGEQYKVGSGVYLFMGVELSVFFGDFTPPRPGKG